MRGKDRHCLLVITFILAVSPYYAIESSVNPHTGDGTNILLSFWETNGSDTLRVYLLPCNITDSGIDCEPIRESNRIIETELTGDGSMPVSITGGDGLYRICVKLRESNRQDCDKDNYYMLSANGCIVYTQTVTQIIEEISEEEEILVDLVSVPSKLFTNTSFISCANITNRGEAKNVTSYSYLYNGSRCISGGWLQNSRQVSLHGNFTSECFENIVRENADPGEYKFKIRVKWNDTNYDSQPFLINVSEKEFFDLNIMDVTEGNGTFTFIIMNQGNIPANLTILLDSDSWTMNDTFLLKASSTANKSIDVPDYEFKTSTYVISGDIVFDRRIFYKENRLEEGIELESNGLDIGSAQEERYLYTLLSVFTLIALATLVWSFVK